MDERSIIELYLARSERAIEETERRYGAYCRTIARRILASKEDSEECVSDTWLRAWRAIPPDEPRDLRAYLGRITRNLALTRLRKQNAVKRGGAVTEALEELGACVPAQENIEQAIADAELTALINRFLASRKPEARVLFVRRYWYLDSIAELASRYHMTESKVKMTLLRTREQLRSLLKKEGYWNGS
ncbi:MAG: sigma-70 family RNA polymerase sigma factor [Oscillospiraceae bacterium]|nr:sigma-70 family RNA polymerase sigma factor [Oscillospiraceae bacterium]